MSETMDNNKYLDFNGLKKYDELIKSFIASNDAAISDAAAAAVASVIDGAPDSFDTLKEIAEWIANNDHSADVSNLLIDVAELKAIDHNAYISADVKLENSLKGYIDSEAGKKQDIIEDLEDIRSGATLGSTALQTVPSEYITEEELTNKEYATTSQVEGLIDSVVITASNDDIDDIFK